MPHGGMIHVQGVQRRDTESQRNFGEYNADEQMIPILGLGLEYSALFVTGIAISNFQANNSTRATLSLRSSSATLFLCVESHSRDHTHLPLLSQSRCIPQHLGQIPTMRPLPLLPTLLVVLLLSLVPLPGVAADTPALILENGGLKNVCRVIFQEWDEANHFARGVVEVQSHESEEPEMRLPFAVELKPSKDKKNEVLEVRGTSSHYFFPPAEKKEPYPLLTWTLTGRKSGKPVLKAKMWAYNAERETWALEEMEFEKPAQ